ncbi:MAG: cadherin-like beta sandwich domain-containing protein [Clostridiales bacterium]|nr:cadherin-like beta sandwich domain-containing protein [Clostridiales bacterium]
MRKKIAAVLMMVMLVSFLTPVLNLRADSLINLSVRANNTEPGVGDILTVSFIADNFPQVVRFGPTKIHYDGNLAEYVSVDMGSSISNFVYNVTQDGDYINVSAVDQYFLETGNEEDTEIPPEERAVSMDSSTVLFSISFRIKQGASGQIPFWIDDPGEFTDALGNTVSTVVDNSISVTISDRVSDDANLVMLKMSGAELDPLFSPDVTEYSTVVERQMTDAVITADPSNLWAGVIISGNNNLQLGANTITITVTAQDGVTTKEYFIHVTRRESFIPDNAVLADAAGNSYTFLDIPANFETPEGFTQKMKTVNEFSVPAFVRDGVSSVLLYLYDGENPPGLYLYNSDLKTVVPYVPNDTLIRKSVILLRTDIPEDVKIPKDFVPDSKEINGRMFNGFYNSEGQFLCYLTDESGNSGFYVYDDADNSFVKYVPVDRSAEKAYSALLTVFMILCAVEAVFLVVIVTIVHSVLSRRKNPRPRHV